MTIEVVADTSSFLLVDKPFNMICHGEPGSLTRRIREQFDDTELYPCHRLDAATSGLVLIAKGKRANSQISQMFEHRTISKIYLAITSARPGKKQGVIKGDMKPGRNGSWMLTRALHNPAITQFLSFSVGDGYRLFVLKPHTGKTHQLRVMMKSLSAPIVGDERYGGSAAERCYLHAYELAFSLGEKAYHFQCRPRQGDLFQLPALSDTLKDLQHCTELSWPKLKL